MSYVQFLERTGGFFLDYFWHWTWTIPMLISGFFLYKVCSAFLPLKPGRVWKVLLFLLLGGVSGMVIWVGDENLILTLPVFFAVSLLCSKGNLTGRLTVTVIFFCLIMPVCALLDTYYVRIGGQPSLMGEGYIEVSDFFYYSSKLLRPVLAVLFYLAVRRRLPERPPQLSPKLWKLVLLLAAMPLSALLAVVLLTQNKYDSPALYSATMSLGLAVLPFVLLTSLALLYAILVLVDHERLEQAERLSSLRESYYQGLQREERQVRTLRHDLRNHLTAIRGLLDQGEGDKAAQYIDQLADSAALKGGRRLCENDAANAVLSAKLEAMRRAGLEADLTVSLPKDLPVAAVDLCALLGNALDNAIEAAEQAKDKTVTVRCRTEKGLFMLRVENAYAGELPESLATTKADKASHGFGLTGMREIAERLNGSLEAKAKGGRFELIACLPIDMYM